ncbi:carbohydrate kinase family protein [Desulfovibrio sp. OttesenSCG-928-A18]|nr:carbohydrate kinase family protein [Desulfovibrio sp. OttesenSCG-928-A18]
MAIYITGSLAYDRIMNFPGVFTDSILPEHIHELNVSFFIDSLIEQLGGNAGNIAHTLALLGEKSCVVATAGKDFARYASVFEQRGLGLDGILRLEDELTASAYIMTDRNNNQITGFHAAAMMTPSTYDFPDLDPEADIALIGPSNPDDMRRHPQLFKERGVRYIYDPAQQIPILSKEDLIAGIEGAYILVGNDYEIRMIMNNTGLDKEALLAMTGRGIVTTIGEQGSLVSEKDAEDVAIAAVPVSMVVDPTGAGDAYRAGLIKGLLLKQPLAECARLGSTCAAFCIEQNGTQGHDFSLEAFFQRHAAAFGESV